MSLSLTCGFHLRAVSTIHSSLRYTRGDKYTGDMFTRQVTGTLGDKYTGDRYTRQATGARGDKYTDDMFTRQVTGTRCDKYTDDRHTRQATGARGDKYITTIRYSSYDIELSIEIEPCSISNSSN